MGRFEGKVALISVGARIQGESESLLGHVYSPLDHSGICQLITGFFTGRTPSGSSIPK